MRAAAVVGQRLQHAENRRRPIVDTQQVWLLSSVEVRVGTCPVGRGPVVWLAENEGHAGDMSGDLKALRDPHAF